MSTERDNLPASIIFISFLSLICTIICIILICQLFCSNRRIKKKQSDAVLLSNVLIILCVIISTVCQWSDLIRHVLCYTTNQNLYSYPLNNIFCFADFLYYLGSCVFYTIAIYRLQISFAGSRYEIKRSLSFAVYFLICTLVSEHLYMAMYTFI